MTSVRIIRRPDIAIRRIETINREMSRRGQNVKVGLPKGSNDYPDGTSVTAVGAIHEFGSPSKGVPQRSYLRTTLVEKKRAYIELFKALARSIVEGRRTKLQALGLLGLQVQTDVREKITDISTPPLVVRVGGNPLVDTGHLRQSINFEIGE
jgi:hypothetical protein